MTGAMRVMTYNVRSLRDDKAAVVRVIRDADPDVACIQEAPRFLFWRSRCAWLASATGLRIAAGGRAAAANLVLVKPAVEVLHTRTALFSKDPRLHQRGAAYAHIEVGGVRTVVVGTHLDGYPEPRLRHVGELRAVLERFCPAGTPWIVGGDINDDPGSDVWHALERLGVDAFASAGTGDGFTLNVSDPTRRIDALFVSPPLSVTSAHEIDGADVRRASDHRPVVIEVSPA